MSCKSITASALVALVSGCNTLAEPGEDVDEPTASDVSALSRSLTVLATQTWQSSGLTVKPGDLVTLACTGGAAFPWPGHFGFPCTGDPSTFWNLSLVPGCPFGSLVHTIGGSPFCYGPQQTNRTGALNLAFNDGVNFNDNAGSWSVNATLNRPRIGMPFTGIFSSAASDPAFHTVFDSQVAQWSTDVYAPPGTSVSYFGAPWMTAIVSLVQPTPCTVGGVSHNVGKTAFVELYNNNNGLSNRIGRVIYTHLDTNLTASSQPLAQGAQLGVTRLWPRVPECYDVQNNNQVHIHMEVGTHPNAGRVSNVACWRPSVGSSVAAGDVIGWYGTTGFTTKQRCATEP